MKKILNILCLICLMLGILFQNSPVFAQEDQVSGFSYNIIKPENQHDKDAGYFDLRMNLGQTQTLVIQMKNNSNQDIIIDVKLNSAKTNSNGVIEYGPSDIKNDPSLNYDFSKIVTGEKSIIIPANETLDYLLSVKMPDEQFDGVISGGIYMIQRGQTDNQEGMVKNEYSYVVGLMLSETDNIVTPNLKLNNVYVNQLNYQNAVFVNYSNITPVYLDDMNILVQIKKKNSDIIKWEIKKNRMRMAPNSQINFPILMNNEKMKKGDYTAHIIVKNGDTTLAEWNKDFSITRHDAKKFNKQDVYLALKDEENPWIYILIVITIIVGITLFILKAKKRK